MKGKAYDQRCVRRECCGGMQLTVLETFAPSALAPKVRIESSPLYLDQVLYPAGFGSRCLTKFPQRAETSVETAESPPVPKVTRMSSSWQTLPAQKGMYRLSTYLRSGGQVGMCQ